MAVLFLCNYALELGWYSTSVQVLSKPELDTFRKGRDKGASRSFSFAAFWLHLTGGSVVQHLLDAENNKGEKGSKDLQIFCVSCGQPISKRVALHHMERCFAKYECQRSIGSLYPTCIEGTTWFYCDAYSLKSKRYCKRLKVLCSEHSWDPKVPKDEVGGCPLVHNVFEFTGNFCCLPKCLCNCYYSWEKLRRAEVDLERMQALHKLEQLFEQEQKVHTFLMNRVGLLALMLHKTIQHDPFTSDLCSRVDI
ncbi:PREDICTED: CXXC-type zinc finger protein 1-like [Mandrillus leucophaeus]|uniref:CXXC-type zinc finger protein 1-like n=1 Tax=Mandrillus leucophaeus TaxID=9568 RepID=UPI0005F4C340|nr:PREDICTED: CXXC-type zinc finger protein 1-like [Mandrillus leucophaeus]